MSASGVKKFFAKVETSKPLKAKLDALHRKTRAETQEKEAAEVVKIAAAAGFKFTAAELAKAFGKKARKPSKAQLKDVTGQWTDCSGGAYSYCTMQNWQCIGYSWYS